MKRTSGIWFAGLALIGPGEWVKAQTLVAVDDVYQVEAGQTLTAEAPGVLGNDRLDGEDLPPGAVADLLTSTLHGTLECQGNLVDLCQDGSFDYTPDPDFLRDDGFTYRVLNGTDVSNVATVTLSVSGCSGGPRVFACWVESSFHAKLRELGFDTFQEGFENDLVWGSARSPNTVPDVTSQEVMWMPNNNVSGVTTGPGPARTGDWGFWEIPHGDPSGGLFDPLRDGFKGVWVGEGSLVGVGGWLISNTGGARVQFLLDGVPGPGFLDAHVTSTHTFFGVIDTMGFTEFEIRETEGVAEDQEFIFGDDFTLSARALVFGDGFESGNTAAWSMTVP